MPSLCRRCYHPFIHVSVHANIQVDLSASFVAIPLVTQNFIIIIKRDPGNTSTGRRTKDLASSTGHIPVLKYTSR